MRRLQENRWAKLCAVLVLLAAAFGAGVFGVRALLSSMAVTRDSWQDTSRFYSVLDSRRGELLEGIELLQRLSLLEKQIKEGSITDDILLADVEAFQEQVELVEERFSRLNTWFRFRVLTGDRQNVVGTNLLENEAMVKAVREVHYFHFELEGEKEEAYPSGLDGGENDFDSSSSAGENPEDARLSVRMVLEYGVPEEVDSSITDEFYQVRRLWGEDRANFDKYLAGFLNLGALTLLALAWILWTAGHKKGAEGIVLRPDGVGLPPVQLFRSPYRAEG